MYRMEHMDKTKCPVCEAERYKKGKKKAPRKVLWYFRSPPASTVLRGPQGSKAHALAERKEEVLNDEERIEHPVLTHPSDASQWKALDNEFGSFGADPRNIRLGASTDGFNPFGNQSTHSTWPVFVWTYNLPPWLCMKRKYIQMSMLIQGPTQPGNDINMYLELLKEELETLWAEEGVDTWDAVAEEYFPLRAALITTVQDYLGYGYISCQVCHGHKACVGCMEETMFLQLGKDPGSSKTVYMGHRRWLQKTDPWRKRGDLFDGTHEPRGPPRKKSGEEIDTLLKESNSSFARWFQDHIDATPPPMDSDKDKLVLALSHGPAPNIMTYQAYDINGYTFYTEEKDKNSVYQNSGVTMDSWTGDVKTRYYGRIEEIWELSYAGEKVPMFHIRWAKSITKEDRYFTTMFLPEANKSKSTNATVQNEPWVLAEHVHQCFFITDPSRPSRVIVRRGKRTIVGMDGVANEEDFEGQVGDPMMEESEDEDTTYTTRRSRTTLPSADEPSGNEASAAGGSTYEPSGDEATGATGVAARQAATILAAPPEYCHRDKWFQEAAEGKAPNTVGTGRDTVKEVDPASGLPVEPKDVAKGYGNQLACILREVINLNETDLRAENKAHLRAQLIARLHSRYKFLGDYASTHESKNIVNSQALLKFTKHLSSYKYMVWKMIADGKGFEEVHSAFPHVSQADFDAFVANEELQATKNRKLWGKEMRELNIGNHNLGSRGYEGKEPYWAKEDEAYVKAGIENPWLKYKDPLERRFIRSRYHKKKLTGELVTDPNVITDIIWFTNDQKVLSLEKKLEEERQRLSQGDHSSSSQASTGRVAWDKPLPVESGLTEGLGTAMAEDPNSDEHLLGVDGKQRQAPCSVTCQRPSTTASGAGGHRPPERPAAPEVACPTTTASCAEAEEYERENFQWDIPMSSQVAHEDAPALKYVCSKKLFDSQETAEEENPEEVATAAVKNMLSPNTLRATATTAMEGPVVQPKKRKRQNKKDAQDKAAAAKSKDKVPLLDNLGQPMLPEHVVKKLTPDMRSLHETVLHVENLLLKSKDPGYPLFVAKVPTGMNFVEKYPADLCFIRFNDIFSIYRMQALHFSVVRLVALSLSTQIVKEETPTITIMDPFYMRESIICNAGDRAIATQQVEDFMLANIKKGAILIPYFPEDKFCTLIVVHPQHSHAVYLDSGRDHKKDYTHIKALLNDALTGFANKAGPLKVERKSRGGLVLTHTTNFPCLRQSTPDNGMDAWYAILQMQEYIKYADDMLLPENLKNRFANMADVPDREIRKNWGRIQQFICTIILQDVNNRSEFFYGYGLPPNDEIELRLEMSRDERPFNSLEGCRPFPPRHTT
ncbi:hypothetical protein QYE76_003398 [Lolium multiflorum]|uniref:Uncharacterized protein n=1 Tax=Lolium multiflorum TaxID=4521 RepID=A0AAD8RNM7_LOLMU|nr:hypothetical protein QYE76_003398 [Lolium multiflorum]